MSVCYAYHIYIYHAYIIFFFIENVRTYYKLKDNLISLGILALSAGDWLRGRFVYRLRDKYHFKFLNSSFTHTGSNYVDSSSIKTRFML